MKETSNSKQRPFVPFDPLGRPWRSDSEMMALLVKRAEEHHDGHLTIMRFTTNWRIVFGTPVMGDIVEQTAIIQEWPVGKTFHEAATAALRNEEIAGHRPQQGPELPHGIDGL